VKTFFVQTTHPVPDYAGIFIEAETGFEAEDIAERITGARVFRSQLLGGVCRGDVFTKIFVGFLDDITSKVH
jgi:hypothetical protein